MANFSNLCCISRAALETIDRLTDSLDLTDYASRIIHPLVRTLDACPELRLPAMETLASLIMQMGKKYEIFIPMVNKVIHKHRIQHQRYDILLCKIVRVSPFVSKKCCKTGDWLLVNRKSFVRIHSAMYCSVVGTGRLKMN